ncbi:hypothetical protein TVNIR_0485 [Thioalkalivibrio nitratireducens DSM 14787]|uniref:Uncharacterized protein n=1 Tax=Thioalkalivibrio nitratireducens (strain DSM 14787 / UNIQEM 213 / ALEN2) TaxID=1255043 RepID=L0DT66_THIND|nr:hypothetical protein TVNIR_0485 [Thioalkalivibrio nitratireducens DSM 14787]
MAIQTAMVLPAPPGLFAALTLWASLRLFNALRALVPRYARNDDRRRAVALAEEVS